MNCVDIGCGPGYLGFAIAKNNVLKRGGAAYIGCGFGAGYAHIDGKSDFRKSTPPKKFTHEEILAGLEGAGIVDFAVVDDNLRGYWVIIRKP